MRVNPVSSAGRAKVRRKRPSVGETESERQATYSAQLPVPVEPELEREQITFTERYRPNSIFLAHLIAARDAELHTRLRRQTEPLTGVNSYRATAALPRLRPAGRLLKTER